MWLTSVPEWHSGTVGDLILLSFFPSAKSLTHCSCISVAPCPCCVALLPLNLTILCQRVDSGWQPIRYARPFVAGLHLPVPVVPSLALSVALANLSLIHESMCTPYFYVHALHTYIHEQAKTKHTARLFCEYIHAHSYAYMDLMYAVCFSTTL
ncbi:hypothetical protein DFP73DRAFT_328483 [Morchella snyderi]|nr:hypothetical protein DFP73DRAFT_328483 [Morchella snyderi]